MNLKKESDDIFFIFGSILWVVFLIIMIVYNYVDIPTLVSLIGNIIGSAIGAIIAISGSLYIFNKTKENGKADEVKKNTLIIYNELYICLDSIKKMYVGFMKDKNCMIYNLHIRDTWTENIAALYGMISPNDIDTISNLYCDINIIKNRIDNKFDVEQTLVRFANKVFSKSLIELNDYNINSYFVPNDDCNAKYMRLFNTLLEKADKALNQNNP